MNNYFTPPVKVLPGERIRDVQYNTLLDSIDAAFDEVPSEELLRSGTITYYGSSTGGSNQYVITSPEEPILSYTDGLEILFKANFTNTAPATINVDGIGARNIRLQDGTAIAPSDVILNKFYRLRFNATDNTFDIDSGGISSILKARSDAIDAVSLEGATQVDLVINEGDTQTIRLTNEATIQINLAAAEANRSSANADRSHNEANRSFTEANRSGGYVSSAQTQAINAANSAASAFAYKEDAAGSAISCASTVDAALGALASANAILGLGIGGLTIDNDGDLLFNGDGSVTAEIDSDGFLQLTYELA